MMTLVDIENLKLHKLKVPSVANNSQGKGTQARVQLVLPIEKYSIIFSDSVKRWP